MKAKELVEHIMKRVKGSFVPVIAHQVYSTDEQVVGVWTDGKPVYRVVIRASGLIEGSKIEVSHLSIENMIIVEGTWIDKNNNKIPLTYFYTSNNNYSYWINGTDLSINIHNKTANSVDAEIIITYTKTTDTPTTSKVPFEPLHEYSTEEKLVGYWIDGKPLYQRTFIKTGAFNPSGEAVEIATLGADVSVISFKGNSEGASGVFSIPYYQSPSYSVELYMGTNNNIFFKNKWGSGGGANIDKVIVIVEYTKTTD